MSKSCLPTVGSHWSLDNITYQVTAEQKKMFVQIAKGNKNCSVNRSKWVIRKDLKQQATDFIAAVFKFEQGCFNELTMKMTSATSRAAHCCK